MSEAIIVAIITGGLALIGVIITNNAANAKMIAANERSQAVTEEKIDNLTREVREHNQFARRVPLLEQQMELTVKRLDKLEEKAVS